MLQILLLHTYATSIVNRAISQQKKKKKKKKKNKKKKIVNRATLSLWKPIKFF